MDVGTIQEGKTHGAREDQGGTGSQGDKAGGGSFNAEIHPATAQEAGFQLSDQGLDEMAQVLFYFTSTWASPGPNRIAPTFEAPFARLEYTAEGYFSLAYFRHTEQWAEIYTGLTMDECLKLIAEDGPFILA